MADIQPINAREQYQATQFTKETAYIIVIRYLPGVLASHRVVWVLPDGSQTRTFDIQGVINRDSRNIMLELTCLERNDQ